MRDLWNLDPSFTFLNHGSYGATPKSIMDAQYKLRMHVETQPVRYYGREIDSLFDKARSALAAFLGADTEGLVYVPNATTGVNAVLRSLDFREGDEILVTNHVYNACNNAALYVSQRTGAKVVTAHIPFPVESPSVITERVLAAITPRTRIVLIDHVTSPTALVYPVEEIIRELAPRGIEILVDGAHAPGMLPLNLTKLGATYYTGNLHKWVCAPKGSAFLWISKAARSKIRPLTISHGANSTRTDKSFLHLEFDWTGTDDYSAFLVIPQCLEFLASLYPGGIQEHMRRNHEKAVWAMKYLCSEFGAEAPCPEGMLGSMASVPCLPPLENPVISSGRATDPIQERLFHDYRVEVPIVNWPMSGHRLVRVSAQAYNTEEDYRRLASALRQILS